MPRDDRFISASEIGTWCYCRKHGICASGAVHLRSRKSVRLDSGITNPTTRTYEPPADGMRLLAL